jgi:hypothetical protein
MSRIYHNFTSPKPISADPTLVSSSRWNDLQPAGSVPTSYTASGVVPPTVDYIRATGGGSGITLTLTGGVFLAQTPAGTVAVNQRYEAMKIDAGAAVEFVDSAGALINGEASYTMNRQWQWAIFTWVVTDGVGSWDVIGN